MKNLPKHIAVIPDGNRRWARSLGKLSADGHSEGAKSFWEVSEEAFRVGVDYFTFWAASSDNLKKRPKLEIRFLVQLFKREISRSDFRAKLHPNQVSFQVVGWWREMIKDEDLERAIKELEAETAGYKKRKLTVLFGYDGKREMMEGIRALKKQAVFKGEKDFVNFLATGDLPEVDLVIRTGGESHWSGGFMMWQTGNAQLYFSDKLWPDFGVVEFKKALEEYARRERRLGR